MSFSLSEPEDSPQSVSSPLKFTAILFDFTPNTLNAFKNDCDCLWISIYYIKFHFGISLLKFSWRWFYGNTVFSKSYNSHTLQKHLPCDSILNWNVNWGRKSIYLYYYVFWFAFYAFSETDLSNFDISTISKRVPSKPEVKPTVGWHTSIIYFEEPSNDQPTGLKCWNFLESHSHYS